MIFFNIQNFDKILRRTLVFVATKRDCDLVSIFLVGKNIKATTINGYKILNIFILIA